MDTLMLILYIVLLVCIAMLISVAIYAHYKPQCTLLALCDWRYRKLLQLRSSYNRGKQLSPPNSFDYFKSRVEDLVNCVNKPSSIRWDIINMFSRQEFIDYYFDEKKRFDGNTYAQMCRDYRSGAYLTKSYDNEQVLKKNLPVEIVASKEAYGNFMSFVREGWFDARTGEPTDKVNKQHIGRAIYWICKYSGIPNPARVFSASWEIPESTIKDWYRTNKCNEEITRDIDNIVETILKK